MFNPSTMKLEMKIKIRNNGWPPGKINEREQERERENSIGRQALMDGEREIRRVCFLNLDQQRNKKRSQDI